MSHNERLHALKILTQVVNHESSLMPLLASSPPATPMTKELCFGVCRHYVRLALLLDLLVDKKPKDTDVWVALLMGIYQLHYMNAPDYAVVKETVALVEKVKKSWAKGLVNAVLRNFCRKKDDLLAQLEGNPQFIYGHPLHLLQRIKSAWPDDWQAIALANDEHPPMTLRVNLSQISRPEYLKLLVDAGVPAVDHPTVPSALSLLTPCDVRELPGFAQGWISVQDAAAQLAATLLDLKSGLRVLDACCAPGGKTCHILETQTKLAQCVAIDVDAKRLKRVKENITRMKVHAQVLQGDALHPETWWDKQLFDRILLDAPCSATGVIRRHADIKLLRTEQEIATVVQIQHAIIRSLWPLLAPGGLMVYATCSIMPEENEQQIAAFVAEHPDCSVLPFTAAWGRPSGHGRQIIPGEQGMDGFFYSVLVKSN